MILLAFQQFRSFTHWVGALRGRLHGSGFWRVRTGGSRRMRRAGSNARKHSLRAGTWLRCNSLEWNNHSASLRLALHPP